MSPVTSTKQQVVAYREVQGPNILSSHELRCTSETHSRTQN